MLHTNRFMFFFHRNQVFSTGRQLHVGIAAERLVSQRFRLLFRFIQMLQIQLLIGFVNKNQSLAGHGKAATAILIHPAAYRKPFRCKAAGYITDSRLPQQRTSADRVLAAPHHSPRRHPELHKITQGTGCLPRCQS